MRNYIANTFLSLIILFKLIAITNLLLDRYTSIYVSYFTIAPVDTHQINDLSKEEQSKFKHLSVLSSALDIIISIVLIIVLPHISTEMVLFISFLLYANSTFFKRYMNKMIKLRY